MSKQPDLFKPLEPLSRRKLPKFEENPFIDDQLITQLSGQKNIFFTQLTKNSLLDIQTGEIDPAKIQIIKKVRADKESFVKIFTTHLKAFFELSTGAYKLLQYVLYTIQTEAINHDKIYLQLDLAKKYFESNNSKISKAAYYVALKELIEKLFIAETFQANWFFINPKLFFNGDRVEFITKFHIQEEKYNLDRLKNKNSTITFNEEKPNDPNDIEE